MDSILEPQIVKSRSEEIEKLVASNELNKATKRLMDFAKEYSQERGRIREVIDIHATFNKLREDSRMFGPAAEIEQRTRRLRVSILECLDQIYDEIKAQNIEYFAIETVPDSTPVEGQNEVFTKQTDEVIDTIDIDNGVNDPVEVEAGNQIEAHNPEEGSDKRNDEPAGDLETDETSTSIPEQVAVDPAVEPTETIPDEIIQSAPETTEETNTLTYEASNGSLSTESLPLLEPESDTFIQEKIRAGHIVFEGKGISKTYHSPNLSFTLSPLDLTLRTGEITAVTGENGNGKTTLLRMVADVLTSSGGKFSYPYLEQLNKKDRYVRKQAIAFIPQELPPWQGTILENLHFSASVHNLLGRDNIDEVEFVVRRLGLERYINATWNEISGGYRTRFSLAKALLKKPKLMILDEPLGNLDVSAQLLFLQDLRYLADSLTNPMTVLISSQHLYEVESVADQIIFLKNGSAVFSGRKENFEQERVENMYEIACELGKLELLDALEGLDYKSIESAGQNFIIHTSKLISRQEFVQYLMSKNVPISYFRDISQSTRKFFELHQ